MKRAFLCGIACLSLACIVTTVIGGQLTPHAANPTRVEIKLIDKDDGTIDDAEVECGGESLQFEGGYYSTDIIDSNNLKIVVDEADVGTLKLNDSGKPTYETSGVNSHFKLSDLKVINGTTVYLELNQVVGKVTVVDSIDGTDTIRQEDTLALGALYSYDALVKDGYTADQERITGALESKDGITVKFVYSPTKYKITVKDTFGTETTIRQTDSAKRGDAYSYKALEKEGYKVNEDSTISGTVLDKDVVIEFKYDKISTDNTGNTGNTDNTGNTGNTGNTENTGNTDNTSNTGNTGNAGNIESKTRTIIVKDIFDGKESVRQTDSMKDGDTYSYEALKREGYTVQGKSEISGTVNGANITIEFIYKKATGTAHTITVKDIFDGVESIRQTDIMNDGDTYTYQALECDSYSVKGDREVSGTVSGADVTVEFVYEKTEVKTHQVTVIDDYDSDRVLRDICDFAEGEIYTFECVPKEGYTVKGSSIITGTMGTEDVTVVFKYKKTTKSIKDDSYAEGDNYTRDAADVDDSYAEDDSESIGDTVETTGGKSAGSAGDDDAASKTAPKTGDAPIYPYVLVGLLGAALVTISILRKQETAKQNN